LVHIALQSIALSIPPIADLMQKFDSGRLIFEMGILPPHGASLGIAEFEPN
jgi:hypothetical protein